MLFQQHKRSKVDWHVSIYLMLNITHNFTSHNFYCCPPQIIPCMDFMTKIIVFFKNELNFNTRM